MNIPTTIIANPANVAELMNNVEVELRDDWEGSGAKGDGEPFETYLIRSAGDDKHTLQESARRLVQYKAFYPATRESIDKALSYRVAVALVKDHKSLAATRFDGGHIGLSWRHHNWVQAQLISPEGHCVVHERWEQSNKPFHTETVFMVGQTAFVLKVASK